MNEWYKVLSERMRSPVYWAFIFSWVVVNWRVFIIIFNSKGYGCEGGINDCINDYLTKYNHYWLVLLWYPLLGVFIYTVVVPKIDYWIAYYKEKYIANSYKEKIAYSKDRLVSGEELRRKNRNIETLQIEKANLETQITSLNANIAGLKQEVYVKNNEAERYKDYNLPIQEIFENASWKLKMYRSDNYQKKNIKTIKVSDHGINEIFPIRQDNLYNIVLFKFINKKLEILVKEYKHEEIFGIFTLKKENNKFKGQYNRFPSIIQVGQDLASLKSQVKAGDTFEIDIYKVDSPEDIDEAN